jgi:hypothetical protein
MRIIHKIDDFLNTIPPNINSGENIVAVLEDIKQIALEVAMLGTMGIDPNKKEYIISSIPNKRFSGNRVLAFYYVSWAIAMPEQVQHLGLDFKNEFEMAKKLYK